MNVAILGHSQLREFKIEHLNLNDNVIDVKKFWKPGARLATILSENIFQDLVAFQPDVIIIFLGGNDISRESKPAKLIDDYKNLIEQLRLSVSLSVGIFALEIEKRVPRNERYIDAESYRKFRRSVNRRLQSVIYFQWNCTLFVNLFLIYNLNLCIKNNMILYPYSSSKPSSLLI